MQTTPSTLLYTLLLLIFGAAFPYSLWAQSAESTASAEQAADSPGNQPKVYQLSGLVLQQGSGEPVPFAAIRINNSGRRGSVANMEGFFSLPVVPGDTLVFSRLGYKRMKVPMEAFLNNYQGDTSTPYLYLVQYLVEDNIELEEVEIFRYKNFQEVQAALMNMPLDPNDPMAVASTNLSPDVRRELTQNLALDAMDRQNVALQTYYNQFMNKPFLNTVNLDPLAVVRHVRYLRNKAEAKRDQKLNYWPED